MAMYKYITKATGVRCKILKRMFAQCYRQIVEKSPTAQSYILLGDAYMAIQASTVFLFSFVKIIVLCIAMPAFWTHFVSSLAIQEPERALEIYEQAIKRNPRDTQLAAKMGQVNQQ